MFHNFVSNRQKHKYYAKNPKDIFFEDLYEGNIGI